jgi:5S rRNA maturation endonuclease (ribonuclease M5)
MRPSDDLRVIIDEFLESVKEYRNIPIIVEGMKDRRALSALGFTNIITLNKSLFEVVEGIGERRVAILTDLDAEGKKLYVALKDHLNRRGIFVDDTLRNLLQKTELRQVEGLTGYLKRLES